MRASLAPALEEAVAALRPLLAQQQASQDVASDAASHVQAVRQYGGAADASASGALAAMTQARALSGEAQNGMQLTVELIDGYVTRMMAPGQGTPGTAARATDRPSGPVNEGPAVHGSRSERHFSLDELPPMNERSREKEILVSPRLPSGEHDRDAGSHGTGSARASLLRRADTPAWSAPSEAARPRGDAVAISNVGSVAEATRQAVQVLASDATARPLQVFEPGFSRSEAQQLADRTGMPVNVDGRDVTHLPRLVLSNANAELPARDKTGAFEQALQMLKQRGVHASGVVVPHSMLPARRGERDQWLQRAADELGVRVTALDRSGRERALYLPGETPQPDLPGERGLRPLTRYFRPTLAWMARAVQRGFDERFADYRPDSAKPPAARDVFTRNPQRYLDLRYPGGVPDEVLNAHGGVFGPRDLWGSVGAFHDRDSGRIVQRRTWGGSITNTVRLRAHEEAHRRQHDAFGMTAGTPLPDRLRDVLHEGGANVVTEIYFGVPRIDGTDYPRSTELMRKVKDRVSEETFLKAYFQGDERANVAVVEALRTEWRAGGRRTGDIDPLAPFRLQGPQGYASS